MKCHELLVQDTSWNWVPKAKNVVLDAVLLTEVLEEATGFRVVHEGLNAKRVDPPISDVTRCPIVYK